MTSQNNKFIVIVRPLTDTPAYNIPITSTEITGKWLIDHVCRKEEVFDDRMFFGLRFIEHDSMTIPCKVL
ncbi:hypothetical protein Ciccas_005047 [Cichlidogyrus casuarinus]|uniref:Uncharacterized protein n=1 Tax=Cichlidogyrus casuarinus TaxID=1844966 RepID=A0ABD2QA66_9PLAT